MSEKELKKEEMSDEETNRRRTLQIIHNEIGGIKYLDGLKKDAEEYLPDEMRYAIEELIEEQVMVIGDNIKKALSDYEEDNNE